MSGTELSGDNKGTSPPAAPADFDASAASDRDLIGYGLPLRPDAHRQPGLAALWEQRARRYRVFEHFRIREERTTAADPATTPLEPRISQGFVCGYKLSSFSAPYISLLVTWTVPNLRYSEAPRGINHFQTFVALGFLDVHVDMTVKPDHEVTSTVWAQNVGNVDLPVGPGDVMSAVLCLGAEPPGRATYVLANETRSQTTNISMDTGYPPAVTITAGVSRGDPQNPRSPLAQFGAVYFDEISAHTTEGARLLTDGDPITMVGSNSSSLAKPVRLNDFAFKTVYAAD